MVDARTRAGTHGHARTHAPIYILIVKSLCVGVISKLAFRALKRPRGKINPRFEMMLE